MRMRLKIMMWIFRVKNSFFFSRISESLCKLCFYHRVGSINPIPSIHHYLNIYNEIGKERVLNLFVQSIFAEQILCADSRGITWNEIGMVPALSNWWIFGTEGKAGHFSVRMRICHRCFLHSVATWKYFLSILYKNLVQCMYWAMREGDENSNF